MLLAAAYGTFSLVSTVSQPVDNFTAKYIPSIANNPIISVIISGFVFIAFVVWIIWDLSQKLETAEDKLPTISVKRRATGDMWNLEITNNGERGVFEATVYIFDSEDARGDWYPALWGNNMGQSELMNGRHDIIKLATIAYDDKNTEYFDIRGYNTIKKCPYSVRHIELEGFKKFTQKQLMQVKITSSPHLRNGPVLKEYVLSLQGIKEQRPRKRMSDPEEYCLGEDIPNTERESVIISWMTDRWYSKGTSLVLDGELIIDVLNPIQIDSVKIIIGREQFASDWQSDFFIRSCSKTTSFEIPIGVTPG